jgi:DNA-binding response OmpR family regulator
MHLLLVEDDSDFARLISSLLTGDRHIVEVVACGLEALDLAEGDAFDAVILDIGLPDMSGLEVARRLRDGGRRVPILMLTARDTVDDRVAGLDAGGDDYLVKPFAYAELAARLRALGRRSTDPDRGGAVLRSGPIALDDQARIVTVNGGRVGLSRREFALLEALLRHPGQALTRDQLLDQAWPYGVDVSYSSVDAYIYLLRQKLGPAAGAMIEAVRGIGYRLGSGG